MLSNNKCRVVGRAAAILTQSEVMSNVVAIPQTIDGNVQVMVEFTVGSLTNVLLKPYVFDGTNWYLNTSPGTATLTATGTYAFSVPCSGAKGFKLGATGTGTVTSSSLTVWFGYRVAGGAV